MKPATVNLHILREAFDERPLRIGVEACKPQLEFRVLIEAEIPDG